MINFLIKFENTFDELMEYAGDYLFESISNLFKFIIYFGYFMILSCVAFSLPIWSIPVYIIQKKRENPKKFKKRQKDEDIETIEF